MGGAFGRGSAANLHRLPDRRFVDQSGQIWCFRRFDSCEQLSEPRGIWHDVAENTFYVADAGNGRVQRFKFGSRIGETVAGRLHGCLETPVAVAMAKDGALFVSDSALDRVLRFPPVFD
eukprot:TRINITY_DN10488_c0_g1_i2.p1 TRINITY_DN10488_c0_g1~~TRINITY_DN10488_c0_g1_i2.p1  ORF type:complete len:119 (-),score=12.20 TRINITY_DN10488_c0_g1_i2:53-409(-)